MHGLCSKMHRAALLGRARKPFMHAIKQTTRAYFILSQGDGSPSPQAPDSWRSLYLVGGTSVRHLDCRNERKPKQQFACATVASQVASTGHSDHFTNPAAHGFGQGAIGHSPWFCPMAPPTRTQH